MSNGEIPIDDNYKPVLALWDDSSKKAIPIHIGSIVTGADGNSYATMDVDVSVSVSPTSNQRVNTHAGDIVSGSFASGSIASGAIASGAVAAGAIASGAAVSGAFADGASAAVGTTTQTKATDATITSWSIIQLLKGIFNSLLTTIAVTQSGTWTSTPVTASTATQSNVASSATHVTILASNASRKGMHLFNDSTSALYLSYSGNATTSNFAVKVPQMTLFEMPPNPIFTGAIDGIWDSANGNARITEF